MSDALRGRRKFLKKSIFSSLVHKILFKNFFITNLFVQVENPPDPPESYGAGKTSPYDNVQRPEVRRSSLRKRPSTLPLFIGNHTNIDDLLGEVSTPRHSPVVSRVRKHQTMGGESEQINYLRVYIHIYIYTFSAGIIELSKSRGITRDHPACATPSCTID